MYIKHAAMRGNTLLVRFFYHESRGCKPVTKLCCALTCKGHRHHVPQLNLWRPAECEEIGHSGSGRATSWKHVITIWLLLIEDVSAVEWLMTLEPSCSAADGLQTPSTHADTHNTHFSLYSFYTPSLFLFSTTLNQFKANEV